MTTETPLPSTHRALLLTSKGEGPKLTTLPLPTPTPGAALVHVSIAGVLPYFRAVYTGTYTVDYPLPTPLVIGTSAIGRIASIPADATLLQPGQLVLVDSFLRARDNPTATSCLLGLHSGYAAASQSLMSGEWRHATYAEYAKIPLENCHVLNEERLLGAPDKGLGLGYSLSDLPCLTRLAVPLGGLNSISLLPGETIIIAPATGSFGGAAVRVALALGANVIAAGRNAASLKRLTSMFAKTGRIYTVSLTGDIAADTRALTSTPLGRSIDAFQDWTPPTMAGKAAHVTSCIDTLRVGGRVSLMGGLREDLPLNYGRVMHWNLTVRGKWMYERQDVERLIKMVEGGVLELESKVGQLRGWEDAEGEEGEGKVKVFGLGEWEKAFGWAERVGGKGMVALKP